MKMLGHKFLCVSGDFIYPIFGLNSDYKFWLSTWNNHFKFSFHLKTTKQAMNIQCEVCGVKLETNKKWHNHMRMWLNFADPPPSPLRNKTFLI